MTLPRIGIIGTGWFGTALKTAWEPLVGKTISEINAWEIPEDRPKKDPDVLILAIPSTAKNGTKLAILDYIESFPHASIVVTSKGRKALKIFQNHISPSDKWRVFSLSGPNLADQIGHTPTATKLAGTSLQTAEYLAQTLSSNLLDVEASESVEIVQRGGMMKNFLVFELGKLWNQLETPQMRIEAILLALHAGFDSINNGAPGEEDRAEFFGISGLGDILLCLDIFPHVDGSRNFRAGKRLASGKKYAELLAEFTTLEGVLMSQKFHEGIRTRSFCGEIMNQFYSVTEGTTPLSIKINESQKLTLLMRSLWKKFLDVAVEKNFHSNTHAWVACELLAEVSSSHLVPLTRWENAEPFLRALLETLLIPDESSIESRSARKIWRRLTANLPFLKQTSTEPKLKHLLPFAYRHSTRNILWFNRKKRSSHQRKSSRQKKNSLPRK